MNYHSRPEISSSDLRHGYSDPRNASWRRAKPTVPTQAMKDGTALHAYVLEPATAPGKVWVREDHAHLVTTSKGLPTDSPWHTAAGKAMIAAAELAGMVVTSDDVRTRGIDYHPSFEAWIAARNYKPLEVESEEYWTDRASGVACRCKPDMVCVDASDRLVLISLKSTAKPITPKDWQEAVVSARWAGYDISEAHYWEWLEHESDRLGMAPPQEAWHVVISASGPLTMAVVPMDTAIMERARAIRARILPSIAAEIAKPTHAAVEMLGMEICIPAWADFHDRDNEAPND